MRSIAFRQRLKTQTEGVAKSRVTTDASDVPLLDEITRAWSSLPPDKEARTVERPVSNENEARIVWNLAPLVEVEGNRIGALDTLQSRRNLGSKHGESAIGTIHVEPELPAAGDTGDGRKIIDCADVDGTGCSDDQERKQTLPAIGYDRALQHADVHAVQVVGFYQP